MELYTCKIYYAHFYQPLAKDVFAALVAQLPPEMQDKVAAFQRWEDAHAALLSKHILRYALKENGQAHTLGTMQYTAQSRPYFPGGDDFNISHTNKIVVCAFANCNKIGIDIERRVPLDIDIYRQQFSDAEWDHIHRSSDSLQTFYEYRTAKEAVLKASGTGLKNELHLLNPFENNEWHLYTIRDFSPYSCHLASQQPLGRISLINLGDLIYKEPDRFISLL